MVENVLLVERILGGVFPVLKSSRWLYDATLLSVIGELREFPKVCAFLSLTCEMMVGRALYTKGVNDLLIKTSLYILIYSQNGSRRGNMSRLLGGIFRDPRLRTTKLQPPLLHFLPQPTSEAHLPSVQGQTHHPETRERIQCSDSYGNSPFLSILRRS